MKKISVVTICYNEPHIESTCESIINQTCKDFEWVVIDGGSNDETLEILERYKKHMAVFVSEKDTGVYNAMNKGIELASGEYINFLNGGDYYYDKESLERALSLGFDADIIYGDQKFLQKDDFFVKAYPKVLPHKWFLNDCIPHQSSFIKRELFDKYGKYNEKYKIVSDWEKWIILIDVNKVSYKHISTMVSVHRYDGISSVYDQTHLDEREDVIKKYYAQVSLGAGNVLYSTKRYFKIFNKFYLLKIVKAGQSVYFYLFEHLPVFHVLVRKTNG